MTRERKIRYQKEFLITTTRREFFYLQNNVQFFSLISRIPVDDDKNEEKLNNFLPTFLCFWPFFCLVKQDISAEHKKCGQITKKNSKFSLLLWLLNTGPKRNLNDRMEFFFVL